MTNVKRKPDSLSEEEFNKMEDYWQWKIRRLGVPNDYWLVARIQNTLKCITWRERIMIGIGMALALFIAAGIGNEALEALKRWIGRQP